MKSEPFVPKDLHDIKNWWKTDTGPKPLSLEHFQKARDYMMSPEYDAKVRNAERKRFESELFARRALKAKKITEVEYWQCMNSIAINGFLLIPPSWAKKFRGVR